MANVVDTEFKLDTSQFEQKLDAALEGMGAFVSKQNEATASGQKVDATLGTTAEKLDAVAASSQDASKAEQQRAAALEQSRASAAKALSDNNKLTDAEKRQAAATAGITKEYDKLTGARKRDEAAAKSQGAASQANIKKASAEVKSLGDSATGAKGGFTNLFDGIKSQAVSSVSSVGGVGGSLLGLLGPIGIAAGAVAAIGGAFINNTDAGKTFFDGVGRTGGIIFDKLTGVVADFFDGFAEDGSIMGDIFGFIGDAAEQALAPVLFLLDQAGITDGIKAAVAEGQALAKVYDDLEEQETKLITSNAEQERSINRLNIQLRDRTKSEGERIKISEQLSKEEAARLDNELDYLKNSTAAAQREVDNATKNLRGKERVSDELTRKLAEAQAAETRALMESESLTEKNQNRINGIRQQGSDKRKVQQDKELAATKAAADKQAALEKDLASSAANRATPQQKEEQQAVSVRDDRVQKAQGNNELLEQVEIEHELAMAAIRQKYGAQQVAEIDKVDAEILARKAASAQTQLDILIEQQNRELAVVAANGGDVQSLIMQQAADREGFLSTIEGASVEAMLSRFDEEYAAAEKAGGDRLELEQRLADLTKQQEEELAEFKQGMRDQETERSGEALVKQYEQQLAAGEAQAAIDTAKVDAAQGLGNLLNTVAQKNSAAAVAGLVLQKGAAIAQIAINASAAESAAMLAASQQVALNPALAATLGPTAIPILAAPTIALIRVNAGIGIATVLAQAITGAYEGERRVGSGGERPVLPGPRDRYIRKVHKDEGIVDAETNMRYLPEIDLMRKGRFDQYVADLSTPSGEAPQVEPVRLVAPVLSPFTAPPTITRTSTTDLGHISPPDSQQTVIVEQPTTGKSVANADPGGTTRANPEKMPAMPRQKGLPITVPEVVIQHQQGNGEPPHTVAEPVARPYAADPVVVASVTEVPVPYSVPVSTMRVDAFSQQDAMRGIPSAPAQSVTEVFPTEQVTVPYRVPYAVPYLPSGIMDGWIADATSINAQVEHHAVITSMQQPAQQEFNDRAIVAAMRESNEELSRQTKFLRTIAGGRNDARPNTRG